MEGQQSFFKVPEGFAVQSTVKSEGFGGTFTLQKPKKRTEKKANLGNVGKEVAIIYKAGSRKIEMEIRQLDAKHNNKLVHKFTLEKRQIENLKDMMDPLMEAFQKVMTGAKDVKKICIIEGGMKISIKSPYWCVNMCKWVSTGLSKDIPKERMSLKIQEFRDLQTFLCSEDFSSVMESA